MIIQAGYIVLTPNRYMHRYDLVIEKVYLLPISDVGNTENSLRLVPTENGQEKKVKYAADYEL